MQSFIVSGIGTDIGKTIVSAVLCKVFQADYWKPVQSGDISHLDSAMVHQLSGAKIIPERHVFSEPISPHEASRIDGIELTEDDFHLPHLKHPTIIEGAGGLMVPLNDYGLTYLDVFQSWELPVYIVTRHYLGSINHTLLTLSALLLRQIPIAGIIVNGDRNPSSERIYKQNFPEIPLTHIPELESINPQTIAEAAKQWKEQLG